MSLAEQVRNTFMDCLYRTEEIGADKTMPADAVIVEGLRVKLGFNPQRVERHREKIRHFLNEMPRDFHATGGGGMSFLNLCMDAHGNQWTGAHETMDMLVCLGLAVKMASFPMPRDFWPSMPGGMPYVTFDTEPKPLQTAPEANAT